MSETNYIIYEPRDNRLLKLELVVIAITREAIAVDFNHKKMIEKYYLVNIGHRPY